MVQGKHNDLPFLETDKGGLKAFSEPFTALPETSLAKDTIVQQQFPSSRSELPSRHERVKLDGF